ncbi:hypothetical protein AZE42_01238 [Rhizopogon vesiculosus]|uniref:sphingolipid C(9)-methyltransferase n=1 Tax=Rhizopogon vesiculosus TaxID=180088 RepID=A0A1J8QVW4_9AGAM|nr:hypothetical protein AZE42_01238 [Rhizopogon vesiculosus]
MYGFIQNLGICYRLTQITTSLSGVPLLFILNDLYLVIFLWQVHCIHSVFIGGDDFYKWYVSFANQIPSILIHTPGIILDAEKDASLEELQDNKLRLICSKLNLKSEDHLLYVGCGCGHSRHLRS